MPLIADVVAGTIIQSAWGNSIRDRTVEKFTNRAELLSGWPTAPEGSFAYLLDEQTMCVAKGGTWRRYVKSFPQASGHTAYLTWQNVTVATSLSSLSISGKNVSLMVYGQFVSAAQATGSLQIGQMPAAYTTEYRFDIAGSMNLAGGAAAVRVSLNNNGALTLVWNAGSGAASFGFCANYSVADLIPV